MRKRTPQEKKALSYARDRRNDYGVNDKGSRKSIRRNKTFPSRAYRKTVGDILRGAVGAVDGTQAEWLDIKTREVRRREWRKYPDQPLSEIVAGQLERRKNHAGHGKTARRKAREFVADLKIEVEREADGRWLAKAGDLKDVTAHGETSEKAVQRYRHLARCVFLEKLGAVKILSENEGSISVLIY